MRPMIFAMKKLPHGFGVGSVVGIVEKGHRHVMGTGAPIAEHGELIRLPCRVRGMRGLHAADLHAVDRNGVLRVALIGVLADGEVKMVRPAADG